ncbi:MAG: helix-turn-helix domain-containing protein [Ruminococcus sp.]|nr:helix-turn-helix domain-containing protein [Ruminococcus sp.]
MNLTVKEVSELLNISERAVQKAVSAGKYKSVTINGVGQAENSC